MTKIKEGDRPPTLPRIQVKGPFEKGQESNSAEKEKHRRWLLYGTAWITEKKLNSEISGHGKANSGSKGAVAGNFTQLVQKKDQRS